MKKLGTSILISCLSDSIGKALAEKLAGEVGLHFACCKEILEYDLFDSKAILNKCGVNYLKKRERGIISSIAEYENSVIFIGYDLYQENLSALQNLSPHIYLHVPKSRLSSKDGLNSVAYEDRDRFLSSKADMTISVSSGTDEALKKMLAQIRKEL